LIDRGYPVLLFCAALFTTTGAFLVAQPEKTLRWILRALDRPELANEPFGVALVRFIGIVFIAVTAPLLVALLLNSE
jgi:hypothetical protein